ncbi:MAG: glycine cleavage system protein GcvH [Thermodesulfobacteriota bacterium]|nr:glycine cleavage system protein GcvH [Thermodesulfobacteriota bacterium]
MKEIEELSLPDNVRYAETHEWARADGDNMTIGINDYAQDQLGDIVFVELPEIGATFVKGEEFGTLESVKAVSEIYMPVSGEITATNEDLEEAPELVNGEPYNAGWIIEVKPNDPDEINALMSSSEYLEMLKGGE